MVDMDDAAFTTTNQLSKKELHEIELIRAQTSLALKQAKTEFWKIGVAAVVAGAVFSGFVVQAFNMTVGR